MNCRQELDNHLIEKGWSDTDREQFAQAIGEKTLAGNCEVLAILEEVQAIDERIEAEKLADDYFIGADFLQQRFTGIK